MQEKNPQKIGTENGEVAVQWIPEEGKIILTDGAETRVFLCPGDGLDVCADAMEELFGSHYLNLSIEDLEETEADRSVMTQVTEGAFEELLGADWAALFDEGTEHVRTLAVLIKIPGGLSLDMMDVRSHVDSIISRIREVFPENCRVLWEAVIDTARRETAKVCVMGIY